ncbi:hypothetical protein T261_03340 [Streptomyces lydicus]|nr:hypothetical protein T261_03340 [Streptomyces lydicus]
MRAQQPRTVDHWEENDRPGRPFHPRLTAVEDQPAGLTPLECPHGAYLAVCAEPSQYVCSLALVKAVGHPECVRVDEPDRMQGAACGDARPGGEAVRAGRAIHEALTPEPWPCEASVFGYFASHAAP